MLSKQEKKKMKTDGLRSLKREEENAIIRFTTDNLLWWDIYDLRLKIISKEH